MDVPVALGIGAGFTASVAATVHGSGEVYFDSVTMFVAFLLAARYLELRMRQASRSGAEMLARQLPATCERTDAGGNVERDAGGALARRRPIRVKAGEVVPADGVVEAGSSALDESMLTGESRPVRAAGEAVLAGCFNTASPLEIRVERIGAGTRGGDRRRAGPCAGRQARLATLADRVAGWFVAALLLLAGVTGWSGGPGSIRRARCWWRWRCWW